MNLFKVAWNTNYAHPLPEGHRFPMAKYELIPEQLIHEGTIEEKQIISPKPIKESILELTHPKSYIEKLKNLKLTRREERAMGFPQSKALFLRELMITQGTIDACENALNDGIAFNTAGGTHHAYSNKAEGFCLFNDQAVAANYLLQQKIVNNILIIDLDVHQGNGTAEIFYENPNVFTLSMHGGNNYPLKKEESDWDIPLEDGINNEDYLSILKNVLNELPSKFNPDFVFFQSGVDVLSSDKLGRLNLSIEGCKKRDELVLNWCKDKEIPLVVCMGGGYSKDIKHIIEAHCNTYRIANFLY